MVERRPLRVVHTSDVHLGAYPAREDGYWQERRRELEAGFANVVDLAIREAAHVLLIAGDFFDNDRVDAATVEYAGTQIRRFPGRTYIVPGNHDPMDAGRIYWRHDLESMAPRLRIIRAHSGEVLEDVEHDLVVWGRGYLDTDWHFQPLEGIPERMDRRWHIAMAHGHFVRPNDDHGRSMLIHEQQVADTAGQWDYLAFGHWESHADVSCGGATAVYSGAPLALGANSKSGWAAVADFDADGVRWRVVRVDPREVQRT